MNVKKSSSLYFVLILIFQIAFSVGNGLSSKIKSNVLGIFNGVSILFTTLNYFLVFLFINLLMRIFNKVRKDDFEHLFKVKSGMWKFGIAQGLLEMTSSYLLLAAQPNLNNILYVMIRQTGVFWGFLFSILILKKRYVFLECLAVLLILLINLLQILIDKNDQKTSQILAIVLLVISRIFGGLSSVTVEFIFKTKKMNTFTVGLFISFWQMLSGFFLFFIFEIFNSIAQKTAYSEMIKGAFEKIFKTSLGMKTMAIYLACNIGFIIANNLVINNGSAMLFFLGFQVAIPTTVLLSNVDWCKDHSIYKPVKANPLVWLLLALSFLAFCMFMFGNKINRRLKSEEHPKICCYPFFKAKNEKKIKETFEIDL